jgi:hypothetical protein
MNLPDIQRDIKAVGIRLGNRMQAMEDNNPAWMNNLNDYYYKKRGQEGVVDDTLKDDNGQRYKSVGLAGRWRKFIYAQAEGRFDAFDTWLKAKLKDMADNNYPPPAQGQPPPAGNIQKDPVVRERVNKLLAAAKEIGTRPLNPFDSV